MRKMFLMMTAVATAGLFAVVNEADAGRIHRGSIRGPGIRYNYNYRGNVRPPNYNQFYRQSNRYYAPYNRGYYSPYYYGGGQYYRGSGFGIYGPGVRFQYWR